MGYPLDSGNPNILWLGSRGLSVPVGDDRSIRRWVHGDCLLHKAVEEFSPAALVAPVEAEHKLVEVVVQMLVANRALVRAQQPALEQRDRLVHPRQ